MVTPLPVPYRKARRRMAGGNAPAPAAALTLVAATFDSEALSVNLQFDRAIDISAMDVSVLIVGTIITGSQYAGVPDPVLIDERTVQVPTLPAGEYAGSDTELTVGAANGVKAVDDGGTWAGVSGLVLPYP